MKHEHRKNIKPIYYYIIYIFDNITCFNMLNLESVSLHLKQKITFWVQIKTCPFNAMYFRMLFPIKNGLGESAFRIYVLWWSIKFVFRALKTVILNFVFVS